MLNIFLKPVSSLEDSKANCECGGGEKQSIVWRKNTLNVFKKMVLFDESACLGMALYLN